VVTDVFDLCTGADSSFRLPQHNSRVITFANETSYSFPAGVPGFRLLFLKINYIIEIMKLSYTFMRCNFYRFKGLPCFLPSTSVCIVINLEVFSIYFWKCNVLLELFPSRKTSHVQHLLHSCKQFILPKFLEPIYIGVLFSRQKLWYHKSHLKL
jgi:hypothetical protein